VVCRLPDGFSARFGFRGRNYGGIFKLFLFGFLAFGALRWFLSSRYSYKGDPAFPACIRSFGHRHTSDISLIDND